MPTTQSREITAASRLEQVRYAIRDLACVADEVAKQGHKILPLNIGDPITFDFETPAHLIEAVHKAMREGKTKYTPTAGTRELQQAIIDFYQQQFGTAYERSEVMATSGGKLRSQMRTWPFE